MNCGLRISFPLAVGLAGCGFRGDGLEPAPWTPQESGYIDFCRRDIADLLRSLKQNRTLEDPPAGGGVEAWFLGRALLALHRADLARRNAEILADAARTHGFIPAWPAPDGRSADGGAAAPPAPPWLSAIVADVDAVMKDRAWLESMQPAIEAEYAGWTTGAPARPDGLSAFAAGRDEKPPAIGWDVSPRFEGKPEEVAAVDLNAWLYRTESDLARFAERLGRSPGEWTRRAESRRRSIDRLCWNEGDGFYEDWRYDDRRPARVRTLAGFSPLAAGLSTDHQAKRLFAHVSDFETRWGLLAVARAAHGLRGPGPEGHLAAEALAARGIRNAGGREDGRRLMLKCLNRLFKVRRETGTFWDRYDLVLGAAPDSARAQPLPAAAIAIDLLNELQLLASSDVR